MCCHCCIFIAPSPALTGRQAVTPRFLRHLNVVGCDDMSDADKTTIFETILGGFLVRCLVSHCRAATCTYCRWC